jgi:uncharacterized protein (TIGR02246 family)
MNPTALEDLCRLFQRGMAEGDMAAVLQAYDPDAVIVQPDGEVTNGRDALRSELAPLVAEKAQFDFKVIQTAASGDIALMHTAWTVTVTGKTPMKAHAIEVARRQPDGSWRWLIGDPFTVGKNRPTPA